MTIDPSNVYAIILAGGSGTRFWPLSRETFPKQMVQIIGEDTLLRQTIKRINSSISPENIWILTTESMAQDIRFHLKALGFFAERIQFMKEPVGRNTAPAIGLAAIYLNRLSPDSVMVVMPSDHAIPEPERFLCDLRLAIEEAMDGHLITFGIKPSRPETGYGYIKIDSSSRQQRRGSLKVDRFFEKPNLETAKNYLSDSSYFWNSGIFVWKTSSILLEMKEYLPDLYRVLKEMEVLIHPLDGWNEAPMDRLHELYSGLASVSIDYGIMERSNNIRMVPATFQWNDLGSWAALDEMIDQDVAGNILRGNTIDIESRDSVVFAGDRLVATIGLKDMVVVDTPDATLVAPKERAQEVRKVVEELKRTSREEYILHRTVEKPWGSYTVLEKGPGYKVKRVFLKPGTRLSLQLHRRRSEHWVVVAGVARVIKDDETYLVHPDQSTYIPVSTKHRLENPGEKPLQIIEVQNGDYVEEDDIERFDDDYGR